MGNYQRLRGDSDNKLFYLIDQLIGGINTEFSDDNSSDTEFESIINFDASENGSLVKRNGFGELEAISEIFNKLDSEYIPTIKNKTEDNLQPELTNDNVVYMKLLKNDNNCFRNLSGFGGTNAHRKYQELYGFQNNSFTLLIITVRNINGGAVTTSWLYKCSLPALEYDGEGDVVDTLEITCDKEELPVVMTWDRNLLNIDTIEFFDKIYFTSNNKGLVCFDRTSETYTYSGFEDELLSVTNSAYKPTGLEIRKVGFNVLGDDPMHYVDFQNISTDSIRGMYLCTTNNIPLQSIPTGSKFLLNIIYTGTDTGFTITITEGGNSINFNSTVDSVLSVTGLKVYEITLLNTPTTEIEIKIEKTGASIEPYYDYYEIGQPDPEAKVVEQLNIGSYKLVEMHNRAVYYKGDTIWFSEINNFNYIPNYNHIQLPIEPTDEITKICYFKGVYVIFTKQSIHKMEGSFGQDDFKRTPINTSLGCHAGDTVVPIENTLFFTSPRGLYALKSSVYKDGDENLKILDAKVKKLTSDYTLYSEELSVPTIRFNGISERAYAVRYRDKYMLFFNSSYENGDFAARNNLDILVYKYNIDAYSTYSFLEKPTFLFMVDNAIEAFCTVLNKELFVDEEVLLDYDFETATGRTVSDASTNGNDATLVGNTTLNGGVGVNLDGVDDYVGINDVPESLNLIGNSEFSIDLDIKNALNGASIFEFGQNQSSSMAQQVSGKLSTLFDSSGYAITFSYQGIPNAQSNKITVSYTIILKRIDNTKNRAVTGAFKLMSGLDTLINTTAYSADFGEASLNVLELTITTGTFEISHNVTTDYTKNWNFNLSVEFGVPYDYYSKGANISGKYYDRTNQIGWIYIGIPYAVTANNGPYSESNSYGYSRVTITNPYTYYSSRLSVGSRTLSIYVNGTELQFTIPSSNSSGTFTAYKSSYVDIPYNASSKTIVVSAKFNVRATLGGVYYADIYSPNYSLVLPGIIHAVGTTEYDYSLTATGNVIFTKVSNPSNREIYLRIGEDDSLVFGINSEYGNFGLNTPTSIGLVGRSVWKVTISNYLCKIYKDNTELVSGTIPTNIMINSIRDANFIGTNRDKVVYLEADVYSFESNIATYNFSNGTGTLITDNSINGINANLINGTWILESGLIFDGINGYLQLPEFDSDVYFENGFKIEFEGKFKDINRNCRILDLATGYNSQNSINNNCSINISANLNTLSLNSTSSNNKNIKVSTNSIDLTASHNYKIQCVDSGTGYVMSIYCDDVLISTANYNYGGISNILRKSNFIGKSNNNTDSLFKGILYNFKITLFANRTPIKIYRSALYEFETAYGDFGKPMYIKIKQKGTNFKFPMHFKKLKNVFIKMIGGNKYNELFFGLYADGHLVNDPKVYNCYIEDGTVVYDYDEVKELKIDEKVSLLGNMRLDKTKLGEGTYQTKKLVVRTKGKNFSVDIYGYSDDNMIIESLGYIFKLGKVKEN